MNNIFNYNTRCVHLKSNSKILNNLLVQLANLNGRCPVGDREDNFLKSVCYEREESKSSPSLS
jgi:hypothetical protein